MLYDLISTIQVDGVVSRKISEKRVWYCALNSCSGDGTHWITMANKLPYYRGNRLQSFDYALCKNI